MTDERRWNCAAGLSHCNDWIAIHKYPFYKIARSVSPGSNHQAGCLGLCNKKGGLFMLRLAQFRNHHNPCKLAIYSCLSSLSRLKKTLQTINTGAGSPAQQKRQQMAYPDNLLLLSAESVLPAAADSTSAPGRTNRWRAGRATAHRPRHRACWCNRKSPMGWSG